MVGLTPAPQCLQLAGKVEWRAVAAAAAPSGWEQTLARSAGREAAAAAGRLQRQQEAQAGLGEEAALAEVWGSAVEVGAEPGTVGPVALLEV